MNRPSVLNQICLQVVSVTISTLLMTMCSQPNPVSSEITEPAPDPITKIRIVPAVSDIAVGRNRFAFGILENSSPIRFKEQIHVSFIYLEATDSRHHIGKTASFVEWPSGAAGVYVTEIEFNEPGKWGITFNITENGKVVDIISNSFSVKQESDSISIAQLAPHSRNKTLDEVSGLEEITTAVTPDPDLYKISIKDAVTSKRPTLVSFATPRFCQTATCGPQVKEISSLQDRYGAEANFIHVEVYENPAEIEGDISIGRISPILNEWGLKNEPFTFVLDKNGIVHSKFEGFAPIKELETAIKAVLIR